MNANAFRHFYGYHFSENRKIWHNYVSTLSYHLFTQGADDSHRSVRSQVLDLMAEN